jgi:hypothetical protein
MVMGESTSSPLLLGEDTSSLLLLGEGTSSPPKKESCHEENDPKEEKSLRCLLLSGCMVVIGTM